MCFTVRECHPSENTTMTGNDIDIEEVRILIFHHIQLFGTV